RALHYTLVDLADLRVLGDRGDHLPRPLSTLATRRGDRHRPIVIDVDRRARRLLDPADRLALRPDDLTDLRRVDLDRQDPRREAGQLGARRRDRLLHLVQDVHPCATGTVERVTHELDSQSLDLDVHLNRGDPLAGTGDLEIHVAERIL